MTKTVPIPETDAQASQSLPQSTNPAPKMALAAIGQICSTASMSHNLSQCRTVIQRAAEKGAKALFLPEASDYVGSNPDESLSLCQPADKSLFLQGLREEARKHKLPISVGVHEPSESESNRMINSLLWIDARGEISQRYKKLHLFDLEIKGGPVMRESTTVQPGDEILPPFESPVGRLGSAICYDLRFPEIALSLARQKADCILYPSAFAPETGKVHWMPLLQARAIESQAYVIAAAQVGKHNEKRTSYGHSVVISPWGEILTELSGEAEDEPAIGYAEIDFERIRTIRKEMPLLRRTDIYPEV
ncbi:hypothetical protein MBLNU230_g1054t1 [Neophaeotheca triangularis]